jgi:hypothetical protein
VGWNVDKIITLINFKLRNISCGVMDINISFIEITVVDVWDTNECAHKNFAIWIVLACLRYTLLTGMCNIWYWDEMWLKWLWFLSSSDMGKCRQYESIIQWALTFHHHRKILKLIMLSKTSHDWKMSPPRWQLLTFTVLVLQ